MFFETIFDLHGFSGEQQVCCPFPHTKADGSTYYDHNPSMLVNLDKRVFRCMSCGESGNEIQMVTKLFNTTSIKAKNFLTTLNMGVDYNKITELFEENQAQLTDEDKHQYQKYGISDEVISELRVTIEKMDNGKYEWCIPVFWADRCFDIRHYRPGCNPKMLGEPGAPTGAIIPHDIWIKEDPKRWTYLCAGEKDMMVARSHGLNAITFTGGEMLRTPLDCSEFRDKKIAICYDNDQPGRAGAAKMAQVLLQAGAKEVRNITAFHQDFGTPDSKEDLTDWFCNYGGTKERLVQYTIDTPACTAEEVANTDGIETIKLYQALPTEQVGKLFRSEVQVLSVSDEPLDVPVEATVTKLDGTKGMMAPGESREINLLDTEESMPAILECVCKNVTTCQNVFKREAGAGRDKGIGVKIKKRINVFAATVADIDTTFETMQEFTVYCIGTKPIQGMRYNMKYLRCTDDTHGVAALISDELVEIDEMLAIDDIDTGMEASLTYAQHVEGTVEDKMKFRAKAVRGLLGYKADLDMILGIDLTFNSVKEFNYGTATGIKGYLDTLIVGESRVGKSDTSKHLRDAYNLGAFVSLAGAAATIPGIVGGSAKDALGRLSTRAGVIPRNNESIVVFEELAKSDSSVIKSLTDVRSSGYARISRVSGSIEMPARLRMLTLSNARALADGSIRPLAAYSGGLEVLTDLVGTAEDIARYDLCMLVGDPDEINPMYNAPEPYPEEVLRDLIRWTWTRKAEDIIWHDSSDQLIYELSTSLNKEYPLHIKLFGSECWKKLCRLSAAAACYTVSTDSDFKKVLVTPDHVRWAYEFMKRTYDNQLFKLRETVNLYLSQTNPQARDTALLQKYYVKYQEAIDCLWEQGRMSKSTFKELCAETDSESSPIMRALISRHFIESERADVFVTVKFKKTYPFLQLPDVPRAEE